MFIRFEEIPVTARQSLAVTGFSRFRINIYYLLQWHTVLYMHPYRIILRSNQRVVYQSITLYSSEVDHIFHCCPTMELHNVYPYQIPAWAAHLKHIPKQFVKLSELNTPIHRWTIPDTPDRFQIYIKRDDLTGSELSGNKVRNLQLIFADILSKGYRHVITGGGPQSGHCRAVTLTTRSLGLTPHALITGVKKREQYSSKGNALLCRLAGCHVYLAPYQGIENLVERIEKMAEYISCTYEEPCYSVPIGGTNILGIYGFITMFQELLDQGLHERFDDIVLPIGTGGTAAGLAIGNYLTGSKLRVHAITISLTKEANTATINDLLEEIGLGSLKTGDLLDIVTGYIGEGYGRVSDQVLEYITEISSSSGILLDPYYTGKCALGMMSELRNNPGRFKGNRILFIHTGGIFGLFDGEMDRVIDKDDAVTNNVRLWPDMSQSPF